jgi:iron complex outermembrane receptor protein
MIRLITLLLSCVLLASAADTASLAGRVTDTQGGAIAQAQVRLLRQDGSVAFSASTNTIGDYRLAGLSAGDYVLAVERDQFRSTTLKIRIAAAQSAKQDVSLEVAGVNQSVVVTASGAAQTLDEVSKPLTVISQNEIASRDEQALTDLLTTSPGLTVLNLGGPGQWTSIQSRGLRSDATAVLVDGMRLRDASNSQGDIGSFLETMTMNNTEHVEVLRGSGSSLYGTNAVGSVINLVSAQGGAPLHGDLQLEGGSMGMYHAHGSLGGGVFKDRLKYTIGLNHINVMEGVDGYSPWRNNSVQGFLRYDLTPRINLTGRLWATDDFLIYGNSPTSSGVPSANIPATGTVDAIALSQSQVDVYRMGGTPNFGNATFIPNVADYDNRRGSHFITTAVMLRHSASETFDWQANYQRVITSRVYENGPGGVGYQPEADNYGKYAGHIDTAGARATARLAPWLSLTGGYEFEHEFYLDHQDNNLLVGRVTEWTRAHQDSQAGYFAAQASLLKRRLQISLSGRAQTFDVATPEFQYSGASNPYSNVAFNAPHALTGDVSVAYFLAKSNTKFRVHGGNSYRAPGLYERFGAGFNADYSTPDKVIFTPYGDPRLAPDRYNSVDGGIDQYLLRDRLRVSATVFYTRIVQVTNWTYSLAQPDPFGRPYGYMNGSGGISRGIETSVEARPMRNLTVTGSYTYVRANTDQDTTVSGYYQMFNQPRHTAGLVVIRQWNNRLSTTFDLYHYSDMLNSYVDYGRAMLFPGFTKADLVTSFAAWQKEKQAARIYAKIDNLFNKTYYIEGYRQAGTTAIGGITYSF